MPDPEKKKIKSSEVESYKQQGYKFKGPGEGGREYYEKTVSLPPAKVKSSASAPFSKEEQDKYNQFLIGKLQSGVTPDDLVKKGYTTSEAIEPLRGHYKAQTVFTEPDPVTKQPIPIQRGLNVERKIVPEASTNDYKVYSYPDPNAGYSKATNRYFVGEKEIQAPTSKSYVDGKFNPQFIEGSDVNKGANLGTVKLDVPTTSSSPLATKPGDGVNLPVRIISGQDVRNIGPQTQFTAEDYQKKAKGGLVGKIRKYGDGGNVTNDGELGDANQVLSSTATAGASAATPLLNSMIPGLGTVSSLGFGAADSLKQKGYEVDENGKLKNKNMAMASNVLNSMGPTALRDPNKTFLDKAIAMTPVAPIWGLVNAKRDADKFEKESMKKIQDAKDTERRAIEAEKAKQSLNMSLNQQMADRKTGYGYADGGIIGGAKNFVSDPDNQKTAAMLATGGLGGLLLSQSFKKGGYVKGPGTGTSDSVNAKVEEGSFIVPAKNAHKAEAIDKMMQMKAEYENGGSVKRMPPKKKVATLNEEGGEKVKLSNGEYKFTPEQKDEIIQELGEGVLKALAPEAKDGMGKKDGGEVTKNSPEYIAWKKQLSKEAIAGRNDDQLLSYYNRTHKGESKTETKQPYSTSGSKAEASKGTQDPADKLGSSAKKSPPKKAKVTSEPLPQKSASLPTTSEPELKKSNPNYIPESKGETGSKKKMDVNIGDVAEAVGGLQNIVSGYRMNRFANEQKAAGKEFLSKAGARPVDQISPEFQDVLNKAQAEAKYGFTPQEQSVIEQQRLGALNQQRQAARFYGLGYSGERQAINESFGRGLQAAIANKEKMFQKQAIANNLALEKASMSRRLFDDKMNAWQQNQQAGSELLAAGLQNQLDSQRYNNVATQLQLNRMRERNPFNFGDNA